MTLAKPIRRLIEAFERLPGIGPKTAARLTFYLLHVPQSDLDEFAQDLRRGRSADPERQLPRKLPHGIVAQGVEVRRSAHSELRNLRRCLRASSPFRRVGVQQQMAALLTGVCSPVEDEMKFQQNCGRPILIL